MAPGKRRRILAVLGILLLGIILLVFAAPLWMPWTLRPILKRYNVEFDSYQRLGYERLELHGVTFSSSNLVFEADTIEVHQPTVWLLRYWMGTFTQQDVRVEDWRLSLLKSTERQKPEQPLYEIVTNLEETISRIDPWVGTALLKEGEVNAADQQVKIPLLQWKHGIVTTSLNATGLVDSAVISAQLATPVKHLDFQLGPPLNSTANFIIQRSSNHVEIGGQIVWQTNVVRLSANFATNDIFPPSIATAQADDLRIPAELLHLEGYNDLTGSLSAKWATNSYTVTLNASALPRIETNLPPVSATIRASGTTNEVQIDQATVLTPWLSAQLSTNVTFSYSGELLSPEAAISIAVDLDNQEFVEATGRFTGKAFLERTDKRYPRATFDLESEHFAGYGARFAGLNFAGEVDWPWITISSARIAFEDGGVAQVTGKYDAIQQVVEAGSIEFLGMIGHEFLPPEISYTNLTLKGTFHGPLTAPQHSGSLFVGGFRYEQTGPIDLAAEWKGNRFDFETFQANAAAWNARLEVAGTGSYQTNGVTLLLNNAALIHGNELFLALQNPTTISFRPGKPWRGTFEPMTFRAEERMLSLSGEISWPQNGSLQVSAAHLNSSWLERFLQKDLMSFNIQSLKLESSWSNGPARFASDGIVHLDVDQTNAFDIHVVASNDSRQTTIEQFEIRTETGTVLSGNGTLPLQIVPSDGKNLVHINRTAPMNFEAKTAPNRDVWEGLANLIKIHLLDPQLQLSLSGSLEDPQGNLKFEAQQVQWIGDNAARIPPVDAIRIGASFSEKAIQVNEFKLQIHEQPITAHGKVPLNDQISNSWRELPDWKNASGRVQIPNAELAPFTKYFPEMLAAQGVVNADVTLNPGFNFNGLITVTDAASRPLPNSGPLHDIHARLRLAGQQVEFDDVHALLGGQPIGFSGRIDFSTKRPGNLPLIDLSLRGENIPVARQTDLVLRTDLALHIGNLTNDVPLVSGNIRLRDSFYLGDLRQLIPGRVASPSRRPPYFSLEREPFANWQLDVHVIGDNFIRARSPLFRGSASANLTLSGPLKEPIALGDVRLDHGIITFPFANFSVKQGYVTLTSENPYQPELFVTAESRAFGYDITMTLRGSADSPIVEFASTPSLSSEQIILMVTAGEVPRQGFGFSNQQRAQRLAFYVGRNLLSRLTDGSGAERLTITTGEEITEQGRQSYEVQYRLSDDWSIVGEYDRFGDLNFGLKWRIYSR